MAAKDNDDQKTEDRTPRFAGYEPGRRQEDDRRSP